MNTSVQSGTSWIVNTLLDPAVYEGVDATDVEMRETHISWVFLVGDYVFKIKKPIRTSFLDYSTLERRKHFCEEEFRLDQRFARDLYVGVVAIARSGDRIRVSASSDAYQGQIVEYAVKMRRFPQEALLSQRVASGSITTDQVVELARSVAEFHERAERLRPLTKSVEEIAASIFEDAQDNFQALNSTNSGVDPGMLGVLRRWTLEFWEEHRDVFQRRVDQGYIRECHGDLHLANVVHWRGRLVPFDGIEFNDRFRWIDIVSDTAFAAMDFAALDRLDLCRSFLNAYLEHTGDYESLVATRWYLVYRAMVRAKVAGIRLSQLSGQSQNVHEEVRKDCRKHVDIAYRFTLASTPELWITHGVSGSGKTRVSESVVRHRGAIRLRSDSERKRLFGLKATDRPAESNIARLYSREASKRTYERLLLQAEDVIRAGFPVVVDATFLQREDREVFHRLATRLGAAFGILDCHAPDATLRQRLADRIAGDDDASDADIRVLEQQLASRETLTREERLNVVDIPDVDTVIGRL